MRIVKYGKEAEDILEQVAGAYDIEKENEEELRGVYEWKN